MTTEVRSAIADVQRELQALDRRVSNSNGEASPLALAEALVNLARMRNRISKLADGIDQGGDDRGGWHRRRS
jgi:hypothetical protein